MRNSAANSTVDSIVSRIIPMSTFVGGFPFASSAGRNLAIIIEVAAMNNRQKKMGYNAAQELLHNLGMLDPTDGETPQIDHWNY